MTEQLEGYRFSEAARTIYDFTWSEFCDWYMEMSKGRLRDAASRPLVQRVLVGVLDAILRLVQPIMPFVAESIWQALAEAASERGLPLPPEPARERGASRPGRRFPRRGRTPRWKRAWPACRSWCAWCARCATATRSTRERRWT